MFDRYLFSQMTRRVLIGGRLAACINVVLCVVNVAEAATNSDQEDVFWQNYPIAVERMEAFFAEMIADGGLAKSGSRVSDDGKEHIRFMASGGASKYEKQQLEPEGIETVWCRNPDRYVFQAMRASSGSKFSLQRAYPRQAPTFDSMERYAYRNLNASHAVLGVPISQLLDHPSFRVLSVKGDERDGRQLVHVRYDFQPGVDLLLRSGELWLSPEEGWAIRESRTLYTFPDADSKMGEATTLIDYDRMEEGVAIPSRTVIDQRFGKISTREEFTIERFEHKRVSADEFTLAHYGIPEMSVESAWVAADVVNEDSRTSLRMWLVVSNVVLLVLMLALGWLRKRSSRTAS